MLISNVRDRVMAFVGTARREIELCVYLCMDATTTMCDEEQVFGAEPHSFALSFSSSGDGSCILPLATNSAWSHA